MATDTCSQTFDANGTAFRHWEGYGSDEISLYPFNALIAKDLISKCESAERNQAQYSSYSDEYKQASFYRIAYRVACEKFPVTMKRAELMHFGLL